MATLVYYTVTINILLQYVQSETYQHLQKKSYTEYIDSMYKTLENWSHVQ